MCFAMTRLCFSVGLARGASDRWESRDGGLGHVQMTQATAM